MSDKLQFVVFVVAIRVETKERHDKLKFCRTSNVVGQLASAIVPTPFSPLSYQSRLDWIVEHVLNRFVELALADNMVKTLVLPKTAQCVTRSGCTPWSCRPLAIA